MVPERRMHHFLAFTIPLQQVSPDLRVPTFHIMIGRFSNVMQKSGTTSKIAIHPHHFGEHA